MTAEQIRETLLSMKDEKYQKFHSSLIPTVEPDTIIGVRAPLLHKFAKQIARDDGKQSFLSDLPHKYYDENQLHSFIISEETSYVIALAEVYRFLPYIDNWSTCDGLKVKCFEKNRDKITEEIDKWLDSDHVYTVRYAIELVMDNFLDENLRTEYFPRIAQINFDDYYVKMMQAWYFATALAKAWDKALPIIENGQLDKWTHNKAIQKAMESYRITPEQKNYLRKLKR